MSLTTSDGTLDRVYRRDDFSGQNDVVSLVFSADEGNDLFENLTRIGSEAHGDSGEDTLISHGAIDRLFGGSGRDSITGIAGQDLIDGETGNDLLLVTFDAHEFRNHQDRYVYGGAGDTLQLMVDTNSVVHDLLGPAVGAIGKLLKPIADKLEDALDTQVIDCSELGIDIKLEHLLKKSPAREIVDTFRAISGFAEQFASTGALVMGTYQLTDATHFTAVTSLAGVLDDFIRGANGLSEYGFHLPILEDSNNLVSMVLGVNVDLVRYDYTAELWKDRYQLAANVFVVPPGVPVPWHLDLVARLNVELSAGVDSNAFINDDFREGLFLDDLILSATGDLELVGGYEGEAAGVTADLTLRGSVGLTLSVELNNANDETGKWHFQSDTGFSAAFEFHGSVHAKFEVHGILTLEGDLAEALGYINNPVNSLLCNNQNGPVGININETIYETGEIPVF